MLGDLVGLQVVHPGEFAAESLPQHARPVVTERGKKLSEDAFTKAGAIHRDEQKAHERELFPKFASSASVVRIEDEATDFSWPVVVESNAQDFVLEVAFNRARVPLFIEDIEVDMRCVAGSVLRDDLTCADDLGCLGVRKIFHHKEVFALEGFFLAAGKRAGAVLEEILEDLRIVRKVDGVEDGGEPLEAVEVATGGITNAKHNHPSQWETPPCGGICVEVKPNWSDKTGRAEIAVKGV